jgi:hypothetical protein
MEIVQLSEPLRHSNFDHCNFLRTPSVPRMLGSSNDIFYSLVSVQPSSLGEEIL